MERARSRFAQHRPRSVGRLAPAPRLAQTVRRGWAGHSTRDSRRVVGTCAEAGITLAFTDQLVWLGLVGLITSTTAIINHGQLNFEELE